MELIDSWKKVTILVSETWSMSNWYLDWHWNYNLFEAMWQVCLARMAFFNLTTSIKIEVTTDAIKIVKKTMKTEHVSKFVNRKLIIDGVSNGSRHRVENISNYDLDVNIYSSNYLYTGLKSSKWCNKFNKIWQIWHNGTTKHF